MKHTTVRILRVFKGARDKKNKVPTIPPVLVRKRLGSDSIKVDKFRSSTQDRARQTNQVLRVDKK